MTTKKSKIYRPLLALIMAAFSLQMLGLVFFLAAQPVAAADKDFAMNLEVPIPGLNNHIIFSSNTKPIADYIRAVYSYAIGIVGILAAVVLMIGGVMWITAGGNTSNIGEAKAMITASLSGLVLVLTSYFILNQINPALVNLQVTEIAPANLTAPINPNCVWSDPGSMTVPGGGTVPQSQTVATDCKQSGWKKVDDVCAGKGTAGQNCCCPTATGCDTCKEISSPFNLSSIACCHDQSKCAIIVPCQADKTLLGKLKSYASDFTITGAWPPTPGAHDPGCHDKGTCVDIVPTVGGMDALNKLSSELNYTKTTGIGYIQYETNNCSGDLLANLNTIPCVDNPPAPDHFHVQLYAK